MKRTVLWLIGLALALAAAWLTVAASGALVRVTPAQQAALDLLRAPNDRAVGQHNAFELFWSLPYAVPEDRWAAVLAEDAATIDSWQPGAQAFAAAGYGPLESAGAPPFPGCGASCLATARADTPAIREAVAARAARLERINQLGRYDHSHWPFARGPNSPIPAYANTVSVQLYAAALSHLDGNSDGALRSLCRDLGALRRLRGRSDMLIEEMVRAASLLDGIQLLAEIRAELPPDRPLPPACSAVLERPKPEERLACDAIRTEFAMVDGALRREWPLSEMWTTDALSFSATAMILAPSEATAALYAEDYAEQCRLIVLPLAEFPADHPQTACSGWEPLLNPFGCRFVRDSGGSSAHLRQYIQRDRNSEGALNALALSDWLGAQPDAASAFDARPQGFRTFEQPLALDGTTLKLGLNQPHASRATTLDLPLPGSRQPERPE